MDEKEIDRLHTQHMESMKFQVDLALQTLKLLFLLNGVAAVAFLGFMGHKSPQSLPCSLVCRSLMLCHWRSINYWGEFFCLFVSSGCLEK
jgi:hypothetical protein